MGGGARNQVYECIRALALSVFNMSAMESDACMGMARVAQQGPFVFG
jgi:hypothetical protein